MTLRTSLSHDYFCDRILSQTDQFRESLRGADLSATVPTCPQWTLRDLARHLGHAHRWVGAIVARRATEAVPDDQVPGHLGPATEDPEALDAWLAEGALGAVQALREAGPDAKVWAWMPGQPTSFWSRRMANETVVHGADAALTVDHAVRIEPELAVDTVEEWIQLVGLPLMRRLNPRLAELPGPGRSLQLHATDTDPGLNADWHIDLTGEGITHRRTREPAAVTLSGPLTELLLVFYRRLPPDTDRVEVRGDYELLDKWLELVSFG